MRVALIILLVLLLLANLVAVFGRLNGTDQDLPDDQP